MQCQAELIKMITSQNKHVTEAEAITMTSYLMQLKNCHLLSAVSQDVDYEAWLKQRRVGIGGSEIAAIMGENHWSSPRQIWMGKMGMFDDKQPTQSESARWGNLLETTVATEWGIRNNRKWIHIPVSIQHDDYPWLVANIDGFTLSDDGKTVTGILEIKTTSAYNQDMWENGPLPSYYLDQANWYCGITGLPEYEIVCLVGGQRLYSYSMPFRPERFEEQKEAANTFWNVNVLQGIEPEAIAYDKELTKNDEHDEELPPLILEDDESERIADAYCSIREKIKSLDDVKKALYAQLFIKLGNGTQALTKTRTISLQSSCRRSCDFDALERNYPEAYNEHVKKSVSTSLRIK